MEKEIRIDPYTKEKFIPRRSNQIYATRKNQTDHNNSKARHRRIEKFPVQRALDKNHNILKKLLGNLREVTVTIEFLRGAGFNFKCLTSLGNSHDRIFMIFNYRMLAISNDQYKISRND
ncbi:MAG TPA: hypothetical protein PKM97_03745 [Bacteroidia bacterium]|nr:hypothetical protein [Bacteroidia bacterium]